MSTFDQCQREYDSRLPDEPEDECPDCGARIVQRDFGFKCTVCNWFIEPDYYDLDVIGGKDD